ncbi:hypothetical protein [Dyadobacter sandarakinus]|uniref:DNA binding HTH domain-containing protein n=1 Tax=Dyadobacter sandarakinus TaxID=2747268 RepID=A0ABX7I660_9BACT|nr:hypothetical protein [Dyadobacter sandarakinus]QRR01586.1 hypothetical protein HWI92_12055 [Dyadobacter sandarakinus]
MKECYKTRQELAIELGISIKTLSRKLSAMNITLPAGLIPPHTYSEILRQLKG